MNENYAWNIGRILLMEENQSTHRIISFIFTSSTTCPMWTGLGLNLGLCNDGLGKNRE
jgi:hypothetical protein